MEKEKEHTMKSTESYIRLCVATIIVIWKSICDDSKREKEEERLEEEKKIKEEKEEKDKISMGISLVEDSELEMEEISKERKKGIEEIKKTKFKNKYEEYKNCENELKSDLDTIEKELNNIYEECDEITSTNEDKKKANEKKTAELESEIKIFTEQINSKFINAKNNWKNTQDKINEINKIINDITGKLKTIESNVPSLKSLLKEIKNVEEDSESESANVNINEIPTIIDKIKKIKNIIEEIQDITLNSPEIDTKYVTILKNINNGEINTLIELHEQYPSIKKLRKNIEDKRKLLSTNSSDSEYNKLLRAEIQLETTKISEKEENFKKIKTKLTQIQNMLIDTNDIEVVIQKINKILKNYNDLMSNIKKTKNEIKTLLGNEDQGIPNRSYFEPQKLLTVDGEKDLIENLTVEYNNNNNNNYKNKQQAKLYKKINELAAHKTLIESDQSKSPCENINEEKEKYNPAIFKIIKNEIFDDKYFVYTYFDKKILDEIIKETDKDKKEELEDTIKKEAHEQIEIIENYIQKIEQEKRIINLSQDEKNRTKTPLVSEENKKNLVNTKYDDLNIEKFIEKEIDTNESDWIKIEKYLKNLKKIRRNETLDPYKIEDVFNKTKKYNEEDYFKLTNDKQKMYEKFSEKIRTPSNNTVENNNKKLFEETIKEVIEKNLENELDTTESTKTEDGVTESIKTEDGVTESIKTEDGVTVSKKSKMPTDKFDYAKALESDWLKNLIVPPNKTNKNYKKWINIKKNLLQLQKNIKKNIELIFTKRFTLVKLVYFEVKNSSKINQWKLLVKNKKNKKSALLTQSVNKRIKLIKKINKKVYEDLLKGDSDEKNKLKFEMIAKLLEYVYSNKKCFVEFDNDISNIKNISITRREIFQYLKVGNIKELLTKSSWNVVSKLIRDFIPQKNKIIFDLLFSSKDLDSLKEYLTSKISGTSKTNIDGPEKIMNQEFTKFIENNMDFLTDKNIQEFIKLYKKMKTLISQYYNAINETKAKKNTDNKEETFKQLEKIIENKDNIVDEKNDQELTDKIRNIEGAKSVYETAVTEMNAFIGEIITGYEFTNDLNYELIIEGSKLKLKLQNIAEEMGYGANPRVDNYKNNILNIINDPYNFTWNSTEIDLNEDLKTKLEFDNLQEVENTINDLKTENLNKLEKIDEKKGLTEDPKLYQIYEKIKELEAYFNRDLKYLGKEEPDKITIDNIGDESTKSPYISKECLGERKRLVKEIDSMAKKIPKDLIKDSDPSELNELKEYESKLIEAKTVAGEIEKLLEQINIFNADNDNCKTSDFLNIKQDKLENTLEKEITKKITQVEELIRKREEALKQEIKKLENRAEDIFNNLTELKENSDLKKAEGLLKEIIKLEEELQEKQNKLEEDTELKYVKNAKEIVKEIETKFKAIEEIKAEIEKIEAEITRIETLNNKPEIFGEIKIDKLQEFIKILKELSQNKDKNSEEILKEMGEQKAEFEKAKAVVEAKAALAKAAADKAAAEAKAAEEARIAKEEADRIAKEEADRIAKEEADRIAENNASGKNSTSEPDESASVESSADLSKIIKDDIDTLIEKIEEKSKTVTGGAVVSVVKPTSVVEPPSVKKTPIKKETLSEEENNILFIKLGYLLFRILNNYYTQYLEKKTEKLEDEEIDLELIKKLENTYNSFHSSTAKGKKAMKKITEERVKIIEKIDKETWESINKLVEKISEKTEEDLNKILGGNLALPIPPTENLLVKLRDLEDADPSKPTVLVKNKYDKNLAISLDKVEGVNNQITKFKYLKYKIEQEKNILISGNIYSSIKGGSDAPVRTGLSQKDYDLIVEKEKLKDKTVYTYGWTGSGKTYLLKECKLIEDNDMGFEFVFNRNSWEWKNIEFGKRKTYATLKNFASSRSHFFKKSQDEGSNWVIDLAGLEEPFSFDDYSEKANLFINEKNGSAWEKYTSKEEKYAESEKFKERFLAGHKNLEIKDAKDIINLEEIRSYLKSDDWEKINDLLNKLGPIETTISNVGKNIIDTFDTMIANLGNENIDDLNDLLQQSLTSPDTNFDKKEETEILQLKENIKNKLNEIDESSFWFDLKGGDLLPLSKLIIEGEPILHGEHYNKIRNKLIWSPKHSNYSSKDEDVRERENFINALFLYWYIFYLNKKSEDIPFQGNSAGDMNSGKWPAINKMFNNEGVVNLDLNGFDIEEQLKGLTKISDIFKNIKPDGTLAQGNDIEDTDIKEDSIIGKIYTKKQEIITQNCAYGKACQRRANTDIEETKNKLRYYYLLILNYVNRIYEGYKINETLEILQLITKERNKRKPNLIIGYKPGLSLLELFCYDYLAQRGKGTEYLPNYIKNSSFYSVGEETTTQLTDIFNGNEMGILALDIRNEHEKEVIMKEEEYNELISHKIFQYLNNYNMVTPVENESKYFVSAIKKIANIISGTKSETTTILETFNSQSKNISMRSSIEYMFTFATGLIKPYFIKEDDKLLGKSRFNSYNEYDLLQSGGNKIINQNIRVKELSKLKKLYKELNKK